MSNGEEGGSHHPYCPHANSWNSFSSNKEQSGSQEIRGKTFVRSMCRRPYSNDSKNFHCSGQSGRMWEKTCIEKTKTKISVNQYRPLPDDNAIIMCVLRAEDSGKWAFSHHLWQSKPVLSLENILIQPLSTFISLILILYCIGEKIQAFSDIIWCHDSDTFREWIFLSAFFSSSCSPFVPWFFCTLLYCLGFLHSLVVDLQILNLQQKIPAFLGSSLLTMPSHSISFAHKSSSFLLDLASPAHLFKSGSLPKESWKSR